MEDGRLISETTGTKFLIVQIAETPSLLLHVTTEGSCGGQSKGRAACGHTEVSSGKA